jgi:hypothetical protein
LESFIPEEESMKKFFAAAVAILILAIAPVTFADDAASSAAPAGAAMAAPAGKSYEVVCASCYITKGASGADHAACAAKCISSGMELALLRAGKLYIPVDSGFKSARDQFVSKAGQTVIVNGKVYSKGGVRFLMITDPSAAQ